MKNLLLTALLLCGAFFSVNAQVLTEDGKLGIQGSDMCPLGGNYAPALGFCFVPATKKVIYDCQTLSVILGQVSNIGECISKGEAHAESQVTHPQFFGYRDTILSAVSPLSATITYRYWIYAQGHTSAQIVLPITMTNLREIYECPPESSNPNFQVFNLGPFETEEGYNICFYMANENSCPTDSGGNPQFHFGPADKEKECIVNDNGSLCPWINQGGGVFVPDYSNPGSCGPDDDITDPEIPEPDPDDIDNCTTLSGGGKACPSNPSDKCQLGDDGKMTCEPGCGFISSGGQTEFFCVTDPDDGDTPGEGDGDGETPGEGNGDFDYSPITSRLDRMDTKLGNIDGTLQKMDGTLENIDGTLEEMAENFEDFTKPVGAFKDEPSPGREPWYTSIYEDGAKTVWDKHAQAFEQSEFKQYLSNFVPQVGGAMSFPQLCIDVGFINFGCHSVDIPPHVIAFIRLVILITAGFAVRRIIFGG